MSEPEPEAEDSPRDPDLENLQVVLQRLTIDPRPPLATPSRAATGSGPIDTGLNLTGVRLNLANARFGWVIRDYPRPVVDALRDLSTLLHRRYPQGPGGVELRFYTVWVVPRYQGEEHLEGIHAGADSAAYSAILAANENQFSGLRFRRVDSLIEGRNLYLREAERQGVDTIHANAVFWWE